MSDCSNFLLSLSRAAHTQLTTKGGESEKRKKQGGKKYPGISLQERATERFEDCQHGKPGDFTLLRLERPERRSWKSPPGSGYVCSSKTGQTSSGRQVDGRGRGRGRGGHRWWERAGRQAGSANPAWKVCPPGRFALFFGSDKR